MQNIKTRERGELVAVDFPGPFARAIHGGTKHIHELVCIDVFTKAVRLYAIRRPTTKSVLNVILCKYVPKYGQIKKILSDQGKQFQNKAWTETLTQHGVQPVLTSI